MDEAAPCLEVPSLKATPRKTYPISPARRHAPSGKAGLDVLRVPLRNVSAMAEVLKIRQCSPLAARPSFAHRRSFLTPLLLQCQFLGARSSLKCMHLRKKRKMRNPEMFICRKKERGFRSIKVELLHDLKSVYTLGQEYGEGKRNRELLKNLELATFTWGSNGLKALGMGTRSNHSDKSFEPRKGFGACLASG